MSIYPNTRLRKGPRPNEYIVLFHGHAIGTVRRIDLPDAPLRRHQVRWLIHIHDAYDHWQWTRSKRQTAVVGLVHQYMRMTGSCSYSHNSWCNRVDRMIDEARDDAQGGAA